MKTKAKTKNDEICHLDGCVMPSCGKRILIADYGHGKKWMVRVCQPHYDTAHSSRK